MSLRAAAIGVCLSLGACATRPVDPFTLAERSLRQRDLAAALQALDAVPVAHLQYPQARAAALEVERNMRRCHELMLEAMLLRSEWRDGEALSALQKVRDIWPGMPGVTVLIAATAQRQKLFDAAPGVAAAAPPPAPLFEPAAKPATGQAATRIELPAVEPAVEPALEPVVASASTPGDERPVGSIEAPPASEPAAPLATVAVAVLPADGVAPAVEDAVAQGLVAVEARLGRGQLEGAVIDLLDLARRFPGDPRVRLRLVRVLHQRALMRYGEGAVTQAIADWQRVLELDPAHATARRWLEAAQLESR